MFDGNSEGNVGHALHGMVGMMVLPALSLIFLVVSFFAKVPGGVKWAAITFGLVVLQVVLAFVAFGAAVVGLLHGANAIAIAAVASAAASRVGKAPSTVGAPEHELV